jgi:hypothetical protein
VLSKFDPFLNVWAAQLGERACSVWYCYRFVICEAVGNVLVIRTETGEVRILFGISMCDRKVTVAIGVVMTI